jgi:hypothetical protein
MLAGDVTFAEVGVPDFIVTSWAAYVMPIATAPAIVDKLATPQKESPAEQSTQNRFLAAGARLFEHPTGSRRDWHGLNEVQLAQSLGRARVSVRNRVAAEAAAFAMGRTRNKIFCPRHFARPKAALDILSACLSA